VLASGVAEAPLSISTVALVAVAAVALGVVVLGDAVMPMDVGAGVVESVEMGVVVVVSVAATASVLVLVGIGVVVAVGVISVAGTAVGLSSGAGDGDGVEDDMVVGDGSSTAAVGVALRAGSVFDGAAVGDAVIDGAAVGIVVSVGLGVPVSAGIAVAVALGEGVAVGVILGSGAAGAAVGAIGFTSPVSVTGVPVMPPVTLKGSVTSSAVGVPDGVGLAASPPILAGCAGGPAVAARFSDGAVDGVGVAVYVTVTVATGGCTVIVALTSGALVVLLSAVGVGLGVLVVFVRPLTSAG